MTSLGDYRKHASLYGTDFILERAAHDLGEAELKELERYVRELKRGLQAAPQTTTGRSDVSSRRSAPRVLLTRQEAAESLGMSLRTLERYVQPEARIVATGQLCLVPPSELERWAKEHSRPPLPAR